VEEVVQAPRKELNAPKERVAGRKKRRGGLRRGMNKTNAKAMQ